MVITAGLTISLSRPVDATRRAQLAAIAPGAEFRFHSSDASMAQDVEAADIVGGLVSEADFVRAGRLRWIHSWSAGPNEQMFPALLRSQVAFTCSKGNGAVPLAEHAMLLMLALNRNAMRWVEAQRDRRWDRFMHAELNGLTCGIIGMGHSGVDLAHKAKAFHMRVVGTRRTAVPAPYFDHVYPRTELRAMLAESDFVVVTAPFTPETAGMLGEAEFRAMKNSAHFICISRGGIADDDTLYRALREGWIAGAGLDAHLEEPLPATSRFWDLPNVIVTPHNGATTAKTQERAMDIFTENLRRFLAGEPLVNLVDKAQGY
jgi:phosphoglycerate dehydrogenase-like enzyme